MSTISECEETLKDAKAIRNGADRFERKARELCKPWMFANATARDMAILTIANALWTEACQRAAA